MRQLVNTRRDHAVVIGICLLVALGCVAWLHLFVTDMVSGREQYQMPAAFAVGGVLALALGIWPPGRLLSGFWRHSVRALVFALLVGPLPFGPEGTLMPSVLGVLCPSLFLVFPQGFLATLAAAACLSVAAGSARAMMESSGKNDEQQGGARP